jgi:glycosyltransferase involved in cell wall biosynthesis
MTLDILLPFYGRFDHFRLAVESVLAQTDPDWRLTIVDDVYPDPAPGEWAQGLGDSRIRYVRNEVNLGVGKNFAKCVTLMTEEHAVIFGCDDVMLPGYVDRVRQLLAHNPDASVVQSGVEIIGSDGAITMPLGDRVKSGFRRRDTRHSPVLVGEEMAASLLRGNWTYFPSLVWRTELLRRFRFDTSREVVPDLVMLLDIAADGGRLVVDDEVVFRYRRHSESVSSWRATDGSRFTEERELFESSAVRFAALGWRRAARAARLHVTSRLNALTQVPRAVANTDGSAVALLLRHAVR